ncbi:MAG: hypothetical protein WD397_09330 [Wenzhouxiangellaceae bacterium]
MKTFTLASLRTSLARTACAAMLAACAAGVQAQPISAEDSAFYLSINIDAIRDGRASAPLYDFFDNSVLKSLRNELGHAAVDAIDGVSIFGTGDHQAPVILLHGDIPQSARDRFVDELFKEKENVELRTKHGRNYFAFGNVQLDWNGIDNEDHDGTLLLAFGDRGQTMITPDADSMDTFLHEGFVPDAVMAEDLMVLKADRALAQGGLNNRHPVFSGSGGAWESELFRKVDRFGLIVADDADALRVTVEAHTASPELAQALENIVKGIVSLKALSSDAADKLDWLDTMHIVSDDRITRLDALVPAAALEEILN